MSQQDLEIAAKIAEKDAADTRLIFENWCARKGISVSKNQSMPSRQWCYHNRHTRQLWKLWKQMIAELETAGRLRRSR